MDNMNSAYLGVYLDELEEQLQVLDEECLRLEQHGATTDTIQRMFRAAHTLKGSAAAMGFHAIQDVTHNIESVFDGIRSGKLAVGAELINTVFAALDVLRSLKGSIASGKLDSIEVGPVLEQLKRYGAGAESAEAHPPAAAFQGAGAERNSDDNPLAELDEYQQEAANRALEGGYKVQAVSARLQPDAEMKHIRALLIHNQLKELGEIIAAFPDAATLEQDENFQGSLVFVLVTMEAEPAIAHSMNQIAQIAEFHIRSIEPSRAETSVQQSPPAAAAPAEPKEETAGESAEKQAGEPEAKVKVNQTVRVDVERLERLLNYVGELLIDNTRLHEVKNRLHMQYPEDDDVMLLNDIAGRFSRVISELQDGMMKTRMLPIEQLFNRFPRVVRDIGQKAGKEIEFLIEGKETELDRTLIEELGDPILHILRNAADHGLEGPAERLQLGKPAKGRITLKAAHQENQIVITIADDGRGIDPQKIKSSAVKKGFITEEDAARMTDRELVFLIFHSGFSTAASVTDISGRGVGMDIVRSQIEKLNGVIGIDTTLGGGTVFTIKLPLTLAIIRSLLIKLHNQTFAVPLVNVIEILRLSPGDIRRLQGQEVCLIRGAVFPLVRLHRKLGIQHSSSTTPKRLFVVMLGVADKRVCVAVDGLVGNQEIVIKSLGAYIGNVPFISGSTILGNGNVALILDVGSLVREEGSIPVSGPSELLPGEDGQQEERQLVTFKVEEGQYALDIQQLKEIITVPYITRVVASSDHMLGIIKLRGQTMPVWDLRSFFRLPPLAQTDKTRIVVVEMHGTEFGIRVDAVTEVIKIRREELGPIPKELTDPERDIIDLVYEREGRFVMLLKLERIVSLQRLERHESHAFA